MDQALRDLIARNTPKINPDIANGLATKHMPLAENYINEVIMEAAKDFPEGFVYLGCERISPKQEFLEITRVRSNSRRYLETAKNNLYMMKYRFSWLGKELPPRYIYLPYVTNAAGITLSGAKLYIKPTLADKIISAGVKSIFIRIIKDKMIFRRESHNIAVDDRRESLYYFHSQLYHKTATMKAMRQTVKMKSTLMHYLLAKHGATYTFKKYGGIDLIMGSDSITEEAYPRDKWVICGSTGVKPRGFGKGYYEPSNLKMAIPREKWDNTMQTMVVDFFYLIDHFPTRIHLEHIDNISIWRVLLGHVLFTGLINEVRLFDDVSNHIRSLDTYIDGVSALKLKAEGCVVQDFYDLLASVIANGNSWLITSSDNMSSLYNKELTVLPDVLYSITSGIVTFLFRLRSLVERRKKDSKEIQEKELIKLMRDTIRIGGIFSITKSKAFVTAESCPGDNMFFQITSAIVPQSSSAVKVGSDRASIDDPTMRLHSSMLDVGSFLDLPKSDPTGHSRINPCLKLSPSGGVIPSADHRAVLDDLQAKIRRV